MAGVQLHAGLTLPLPASDRGVEQSPSGFFAVVPELTQETTWKVGWKVASPWKPPEADRHHFFAIEGEAVPWAPSRSREQGETSVNSPKQKQKKVLGAVGKAITMGIACFGVACTGPQVRPEPPGEPCPSGAVQAMAELSIGIGDDIDASFLSGPLREVIPVREGWTRVELGGRWEDLPFGTTLRGRLLFGGERVYGRFTEAQNAEGTRTWPVCMELLNHDNERGLPMKPGSTAETAKVFNSVGVKAVDRFE
jgi:serine/threonine-protein kinase